MKTLVIAENEAAARELAAGARAYADEVVYATFADPVTGIADKCLVVEVPEGQAKEAAFDTFVKILADEDPQMVFFEPTRRLKALVGRLAAHDGASVMTDISAIDEESVKTRYFGGIAERTAKSITPVAFCSAGAGTFKDAEPSGTDVVETVEYVAPAVTLECVERETLPPAEVDLTAADKVVAAGRGFGSEEELEEARTFCKAIGAELGCTRPLTETEDWFPREAYIGVSGLMLSPEVYVGIGVSGQMQHMVGVDRAQVAFAINKDAHAPIFDKVDYGLIGAINDVLPKINAKLS